MYQTNCHCCLQIANMHTAVFVATECEVQPSVGVFMFGCATRMVLAGNSWNIVLRVIDRALHCVGTARDTNWFVCVPRQGPAAALWLQIACSVIHRQTHTHTHTHYIKYINSYKHTLISAYIILNTYTYIHTHTHAYIYIYIYIHIHTHIYIHSTYTYILIHTLY